MIHRSFHEGPRLDVAGLNEILVLVDRSETRLTEVGLNTWRKGLEGPPHSHDAKEQIFFVIRGRGVVVIGGARYPVEPGSLLYVPPRVVHQTLVTGESPLSYLLFNAFLDPGKEGHASFAEHIEKVKHLRRQQAQAQRADVAGARPQGVTERPGKHLKVVCATEAMKADTDATVLLDGGETWRSEVACLRWRAGMQSAQVGDSESERTFFVLAGQGCIHAAGERAELRVGDVAFVPWREPHRLQAGETGLACLCFRTRVADVAERR